MTNEKTDKDKIYESDKNSTLNSESYKFRNWRDAEITLLGKHICRGFVWCNVCYDGRKKC